MHLTTVRRAFALLAVATSPLAAQQTVLQERLDLTAPAPASGGGN